MKKYDVKGYQAGRTVQWEALGITSIFLENRVLEEEPVTKTRNTADAMKRYLGRQSLLRKIHS